MKDLFTELTQMLLHTGMSKRIIKKSKKYLDEAVSKEGISLENFKKLMDVCVYDVKNKQYDLKLYKKWDFAGCYLIHNLDKNIYHVGRSTKVLYKVDRNFRGYENVDVYNDYLNGDSFNIRFFPNEYDFYEDTKVMEDRLKRKYGEYVVLPKQKRKGNIGTILFYIVLIIYLIIASFV